MPVVAKEQDLRDTAHVDGNEIIWPPVIVEPGDFKSKNEATRQNITITELEE